PLVQFAADGNSALMTFNEMADEVQADAKAGFLRPPRSGALELAENIRAVRLINAASAVADDDGDVFPAFFQLQTDGPAVRRKFERIGQQVEQRDLYLFIIRLHRYFIRRKK